MPVLKTRESKFKAGDRIPEFEAKLQNGRKISADSIKDKKTILFFYNHDGSETCTKEACNIRDNFKNLKKAGYTVFGVSVDSAKKHSNFIEKYQLPYHLVVDTDNALARIFDIYGPKKFMGRTTDAVHRTTFVIGEDGRFEAVIHPVESSKHSDQILEALRK